MASTKDTTWQLAPGRAAGIVLVALAVGAGWWGATPTAQTFDSGSDGSDGALNVAANSGEIFFDPNDSARWGRVLDADGDGVFNFTTISIGGGNTTLRFTGDRITRSVYWLASGAISIQGALVLDGADGVGATTDLGVRRQLAIPGAGGFAGGAGGRTTTGLAPTAGDGPGGGAAGVAGVGTCGFSTNGCGLGGRFTGNRYLIDLIGGSGGGGALLSNGLIYNGGAGGGAILLASSASITLGSGAGIYARGGGTVQGLNGGGSGGAIRLVAPTLNAGGQLMVNGGVANYSLSNGRPGIVRLERFTQNGSFTFGPDASVAVTGSPIDPATLRPAGTVRVTSVAGIAVPASPSGSFAVPDVSISSGAAVPVQVEATGVPPGTVVTLWVYPQTPDDVTVINLPPVQGTLAGTLERSTMTVNFAFPYGFSRGTLRATW